MNDARLINYDLVAVDGDIAIGEAITDDVLLILMSARGHWRFAPMIGADIYSILGAPLDKEAISKLIRFALKADGITMKSLTITGEGEFQINAVR